MGNPDSDAANKAKIGANKITEKPRYAKNINKNKLRIIPSTSKQITSLLF